MLEFLATHQDKLFEILAGLAYAELRVRPLFVLVLARAETAATNTTRICTHLGIEAMTEAQGEERAEHEAPSIKPALTGAATIAVEAVQKKTAS